MARGMLDSFGYPLRGERRTDAVVAVWVLLLANGLLPVLPLVPLSGYLLLVVGSTLDGADAPPPVMDDLRGTLRRGAGASVVVIAYLLLPVGFVLVVLVAVTTGRAGSASSLPVVAAVSVGAVALLAASYLLPVGLAGYARTGRLRAAFDRSLLRSVGRSGRYLLSWVAAVVVLDLAGLLVGALGSVSPVGLVVATLVGAYGLLVATRLLGLGVADSGGVDAWSHDREEPSS